MSFRVENLKKSYYQMKNPIPVLNGVSFELQKGESLAVVGASGIGKSTLLHCLGLIDQMDSGEIFLDGSPVPKKEKARCETRRETIGFVFQFHYLMAELTALENVTIPLLLSGVSRDNAEAKAEAWLQRVGLGHRLHHRPAELSGGEQQRVAIARALVHSPKIILADEPTGNLDPETAGKVFEVLVEQCKSLDSILIMATHNLELAKNLSRVASLQKGVLV
ncbi:MAG: lolD 3 [Bacteriovoracaceae bacterium]|nr:lolD 3 [Bacteriovoracaceae bacterium]